MSPLGSNFQMILINRSAIFAREEFRNIICKMAVILSRPQQDNFFEAEWCICVLKTIIASDNGLSPGRHQAIIWTNAGILLSRPLETNFSDMLIRIHTFPFHKMRLKISPAKSRTFSLGLNVLSICLHRCYRDASVPHGSLGEPETVPYGLLYGASCLFIFICCSPGHQLHQINW